MNKLRNVITAGLVIFGVAASSGMASAHTRTSIGVTIGNVFLGVRIGHTDRCAPVRREFVDVRYYHRDRECRPEFRRFER